MHRLPRAARLARVLSSALLLSGAAIAQEPPAPEAVAQPVAAEPAEIPPWKAMEYGPFLSGTIRAPRPEGNVALKGVAVRLGGNGEAAAGMLFDTELLRWAAGWTGGFLELHGTAYDGEHGPTPCMSGRQVFGTAVRPGVAAEGEDPFADPRPLPFGPLPRAHARYRGLYRHGERVVVAYTAHGCDVLDAPALVYDGERGLLTRTLEVGPRAQALRLLVAEQAGAEVRADGDLGWLAEARADGAADVTAVRCSGAGSWSDAGAGRLVLELAPGTAPVRLVLAFWRGQTDALAAFAQAELPAAEPLRPCTEGGPALWNEPVTTQGVLGTGDGAWVVDTLTVPYANPWNAWMRIAALDFFTDGRAAVSTWNGDVWTVAGIDGDLDELVWRRFATGLFDPLGLVIVGDVVHTLGRDQISRLHDLDADGEADWYECFNNDVMITANFHEFAFDLQTDPEGNFYFSKGGPVRPGGRGFERIAPHHGCVLKVAKDGSALEVYATGLRAPNGIGVGPDGRVTSGDNEGTWTPRCRLNWIEPGAFLGCVDTAHRDPAPTAYDLPVCWMPMEVDNSSGGQVWVTSARWGPFANRLLHLSYGTCSLFAVLLQEVDGVMQGGVARFPLSFGSSCMRGRFHPRDGQLYVCGLKGWQTSAALPSALHRVRYTGAPARMPAELTVLQNGIRIAFTDALDPVLANDPQSFTVERWNYVWSERYGSPELAPGSSVDVRAIAADDWNSFQEREAVAVAAALLQPDGKTVFLAIDGLAPVMQMRIRYDLDAADGAPMRGEIHHTIHRVPPARGP